MITGLNNIPLKFYVCIEHTLEVKVTVRDLQIFLTFGLVTATTHSITICFAAVGYDIHHARN